MKSRKSNITRGYRKQAEDILKDPQTQIVKGRWGPFTLAEVNQTLSNNGRTVRGYGMARRSVDDSENYTTGQKIAELRAAVALFKKLNKKRIHHPLMG